MVVGLIFAAAVSTAAAPPLFVPPKGMTRVHADERVQAEFTASHARFVAAYRGFVKVKPSWSPVSYSVPESIIVASWPAQGMNAGEWGVTALSRMASVPLQELQWCRRHPHCSMESTRVKNISSGPVAICGGKRGWLSVTEGTPQQPEIRDQIFVRSANTIYIAYAEFPQDPGDQLHVSRALLTLCPRNAGEVSPAPVALPITQPQNWTRGTGGEVNAQAAPFSVLAYWYRLMPKSTFAQWLTIANVVDTSENVTPEQQAKEQIEGTKAEQKDLRVQTSRAITVCSRADAWYAQWIATNEGGERYIDETMYAYAHDTLYLLRYVRSASEPEDAGAHKALFSLCP
jgi:hypothetical protein